MSTATSRTKQQADKAKTSAAKTADQAQRAGRQAERTIRSVVTDTAYATVGLGDTAVGFVRSLNKRAAQTPQRIISLPREAPKAVRTVRDQSAANARKLRGQAAEEFDELTTRGRTLVGSVRSNRSTQESVDRARTARSQVKAAVTSVSRAVKTQSEALDDAVDAVGTTASAHDRKTLESRTVEELQTLAAERDLEGRSQMTKKELVAALSS